MERGGEGRRGGGREGGREEERVEIESFTLVFIVAIATGGGGKDTATRGDREVLE